MAPRETAGPSTEKGRTDPWSTATSAWVQTIEKLTEQAGKAPSALRVPTDLLVQWVTFNERIVKTNLELFLHLASRTRTAAKKAAHGAASTAAHTVDVATDLATSGVQAATDAATTAVKVAPDIQRGQEAADQDPAETERVEAEADARDRARREAAAQEAAAREAAEQQAAQLQAAVADVDEATAATRERYLGVKKAELAAELAHRGLPRTGTIPQLIDRLVADDAENPARARRPIG